MRIGAQYHRFTGRRYDWASEEQEDMKTTAGTSQDEQRAAARPHVAREPLAVGVYETTPRFRAVEEHACVVTADNRAVVAVTGKAGDAESEVYAELFAAAPDLYAACMAAASWFSSDDSETSHELAESIEDQLNDAILKARGLPPA